MLWAPMLAACKATNTGAPRSPVPATQPASASARSAAPASPTPLRPQTTVVARPGVPGQIVLTPSGPRPAAITIQAGRSATWVNATGTPLRIISDEPGLFDTGDITPGESVSVTLTATGEHPWHEASDPAFAGTVTVLP